MLILVGLYWNTMSTSSLKLQPVDVQSFDILELAAKTPQALNEMFGNDTELHVCVTHRDLKNHDRAQMIFTAVENITQAVVQYANENTEPGFDLMPDALYDGVRGFLRESINQFNSVSSDVYVQMDIRLLCIKESGKPLSLSTKTSFIDTLGNYKSLN